MKSRTAVLICTDIYRHAEKKTGSLSFVEQFVKDINDPKFLGFGEVESRIFELAKNFPTSGKSMMLPMLISKELRKITSPEHRQAAMRKNFEYLYGVGSDRIFNEIAEKEQSRKPKIEEPTR